MVQETPAIQSVDQATKIEHLLTPKGIDTRFAPFISGRAVRERSGEFFGKKSILTALLEQLKTNGIAVIEGGYRSGKTSLLNAIRERLEQEKLVQISVDCDLQSDVSKLPEQVVKDIQLYLDKLTPGSRAVITFEEIEAYDKQNNKLLEAAQQLKEQGHMIVFSVIGDLHGNSPAELPRETKDGLLRMTNNVAIVNQLLDDNEIRQLLEHGGEPLFTDPLIKYLIAQAGGHPLFAQLLAGSSFELLKYGSIKPEKIAEELKSSVEKRVLGQFGAVVDTVIAAGFNPLTWEWNGQGEKPNVDVYVNMLPRFTSTIFREWLADYMKKKAT